MGAVELTQITIMVLLTGNVLLTFSMVSALDRIEENTRKSSGLVDIIERNQRYINSHLKEKN